MSEYGRELTYEELKSMIGEEVLVRDTLDVPEGSLLPEQKCLVNIDENGTVFLENAIYVFEYDLLGKCKMAKFHVYEITS